MRLEPGPRGPDQRAQRVEVAAQIASLDQASKQPWPFSGPKNDRAEGNEHPWVELAPRLRRRFEQVLIGLPAIDTGPGAIHGVQRMLDPFLLGGEADAAARLANLINCARYDHHLGNGGHPEDQVV